MNTQALRNPHLAAGHPERRKRGRLSDKTWWPWLKRGLTLVFFALVVALLWRYAEHVDWDDV